MFGEGFAAMVEPLGLHARDCGCLVKDLRLCGGNAEVCWYTTLRLHAPNRRGDGLRGLQTSLRSILLIKDPVFRISVL